MKTFIVSISLAIVLTTAAVATAMRFMDSVQAEFATKTSPATKQRALTTPAFTLASYK